LFHMLVLIFLPTVNSSAIDKQSYQYLKPISQLGINGLLLCIDIYITVYDEEGIHSASTEQT
jgi:hypothetical protein